MIIDIKNIKVNSPKKIYNSKICYDKFRIEIKSFNPLQKILYPEFIIQYKNVAWHYVYSTNFYTIPSKYWDIAKEMLDLFEKLIIIPARLQGSKYNLFTNINERFESCKNS